MKLFEGCLLACDVDGTLLVDGVIPQNNIDKIKFFTENGGIFALATGRTIGAVSSVTDKIDCISAAVLSNGGMVYDYNREKILFETRIDKSDYEVMYRVKEAFPEIGIEIHYRKNVGVYTKTKETDDHETYEDLPSVVYTKEQIENVSLNKIIYMQNSQEDNKRLRDLIEKIPNSCRFVDTSVTIYGKKRNYIEQMPIGVTKSAGVQKAAGFYDIKKGNLFAIGDYFNDIDMLNIADISAAPKNSPDEVLKAANYLTTNAENGAVADFIDYLTKIRRK
ncbi:MAG: HAD family hydrolase [Clostridia bacterium]|nr:HAD family hydrolase [Clostridia bacterium]